jgi:PHD/YefM family antitoxin component YafN of YafNO toxin-antitoxin module
MIAVPAQEIKRRGISAVDEALERGPVHIMRNNRARYVVLSQNDYEQMLTELSDARITAAEADVAAGRVRRGSAKQLARRILRDAA